MFKALFLNPKSLHHNLVTKARECTSTSHLSYAIYGIVPRTLFSKGLNIIILTYRVAHRDIGDDDFASQYARGKIKHTNGKRHVYAILGLKTGACDPAPLGNPTTFLIYFSIPINNYCQSCLISKRKKPPLLS